MALAILALVLGACSNNPPVPSSASPAAPSPLSPSPASPTHTPTPFPPSPTPVPLAARVNGEEISLAQYQAELARYQAASGKDLATEEAARVLDDLIDQLLLAQAAAAEGFVVDEALVQERIDGLAANLGSAQALEAWMATNGYLEPDFRRDLARSIAAAWMRDRIAEAVPEAAEQVHARQILVYKPEQAGEALARLQAGKDFASLAAEYNTLTGGDLGWFPQGYLPHPALEAAAFALQPGEYSSIIETPSGFHLLQVIERDPQRPLDSGARLILQTQALLSWLETQRGQSEIEVLLP